MLDRKNRLKKKKDFEAVFKNSKTFKEGFLILKIAENNTKEDRFGFMVSQKVSKKATIRNKIKRRLREIIRLKIKNSAMFVKKEAKKNGKDIILVSLSGIEKKNFSETEETATKLLEKAGISQ